MQIIKQERLRQVSSTPIFPAHSPFSLLYNFILTSILGNILQEEEGAPEKGDGVVYSLRSQNFHVHLRPKRDPPCALPVVSGGRYAHAIQEEPPERVLHE